MRGAGIRNAEVETAADDLADDDHRQSGYESQGNKTEDRDGRQRGYGTANAKIKKKILSASPLKRSPA